jgi:hypothetical protein
MSVTVSIHGPDRAKVTEFVSGGKIWGCVALSEGGGQDVEIYTTPEKARAIAAIVNPPADVEGAGV